MKKYSAFAQYLSQVPGDTAELTFEQIEEIIGNRLPKSALRHHAWWSNEQSGTHNWAHMWQDVGWLRDSVDLERRAVRFRRSLRSAEEILTGLLPRSQETIFDLLQLAGISTDEWLMKADGSPVENVKANPNFCYNWSFGSPREGYALCIWHDTLVVRDGQIIFEENLRTLAEKLQADARNPTNSSERKSRALAQALRAQAFDDALNVSYSRGLALSVIVNEGDRRSRDELGVSASHVLARALDPIPWYVHAYQEGTGEALLVREVKPAGVEGHAPHLEDEYGGPPDDVQLRAIKLRRGQGKFREMLLSAYRRSCAVTGCRIVDLLEAAHIRPHSDEPNYSVTNGLLLRADIHTLFDIGLLAVDSRMCVRVAPSLLQSEYRNLDGKQLRHPEYPSEMPNTEALERRYSEFRKRHKL